MGAGLFEPRQAGCIKLRGGWQFSDGLNSARGLAERPNQDSIPLFAQESWGKDLVGRCDPDGSMCQIVDLGESRRRR